MPTDVSKVVVSSPMRFARFLSALLLICAAAGLLAVPGVHAQVEPGQTFTARVVEVTDGDT